MYILNLKDQNISGQLEIECPGGFKCLKGRGGAPTLYCHILCLQNIHTMYCSRELHCTYSSIQTFCPSLPIYVHDHSTFPILFCQVGQQNRIQSKTVPDFILLRIQGVCRNNLLSYKVVLANQISALLSSHSNAYANLPLWQIGHVIRVGQLFVIKVPLELRIFPKGQKCLDHGFVWLREVCALRSPPDKLFSNEVPNPVTNCYR